MYSLLFGIPGWSVHLLHMQIYDCKANYTTHTTLHTVAKYLSLVFIQYSLHKKNVSTDEIYMYQN